MIVSMPSKQMLHILGSMEQHATLNHGCETGGLTIPPNLMRDVASGAAFAPDTEDVAEQHARLNILSAADYPTSWIQPLYEVLRQHRNFRVAWVFGVPPGAGLVGRKYQVLVLMEPRDETISHELSMVLAATKVKLRASENECELGYLPEDPAYVAGLFQEAAPFYVAPDYPPPPGAKAAVEV